MKRSFYFFFFVLLIGTITVNAQNFATKGAIELGGSIGFSSTTFVYDGESSDDALSSFTVQPYIGYFIINGLELGLIPSFTSQSSGDNSISSLGIYFAPAWNFDLKNNLFPFIEGRIGYNSINYDIGEGDGNTSSGLAFGLRGGVKVQVGNSALVNFALYYDQTTLNPEDWEGDRNGENVFGVMAGFTIFLGK